MKYGIPKNGILRYTMRNKPIVYFVILCLVLIIIFALVLHRPVDESTAMQTSTADVDSPFWEIKQLLNIAGVKSFVTQKERIDDRLRKYLDTMADHPVNLSEIDALSKEFFKDTHLSRQQKISLLIERLLQNPKVFGLAEQYCCDLLDAMHPFEFAREIITVYDQTYSPYAKTRLIQVLKSISLSDIPQEEMNPEWLKAMKDNLPIVQMFLHRIIQRSDQAEFADALGAYCSISKPDESEKMTLKVINEWLRLKRTGEFPSDSAQSTRVLRELLKSGIATPVTQDNVIPKVVTLVKTFSNKELESFNEFLYHVVPSLDLTDKAQTELRQYLKDREPQPAASPTYFQWANAFTRVSGGSDPTARLGMIADLIRNSNEPLNIASVIGYGPVEILGLFTSSNLSSFRTQLEEAAQRKDNARPFIYRAAIEVIDKYQARAAAQTQ
ncbi:MAG: hypothetical protein CSYNP_03360 [Syntrophus sp. SKADARSKE-3]|nr:hypothetical protein [Syntrophus sp. SKADARSKE-3]